MDLYEARKQLNQGKTIFDMDLRVTFYARVSTDKDEQLHSLKAQIGYYQDYICKNPNWTYVDGYIDEGLSGTSVLKRESFLNMIDDAKKGKFDFIITKEISRFSRNTIDSIKYTQELLSSGVGVFFQYDNINTLLPDSELRLTIMSSIAQDEVRKLSERTKFGFKRAIEKGVILGNNKIWGYNKKDGVLSIDEKEAKIIEQIFDMYANQRMGMRAIAKSLSEKGFKNKNGNPFSFTTINNILTNPKYKGYYCGGKTHKYDFRSNSRKYLDQSEWTMYKDEENVPPIVSEELWDKANDILKNRSEKMQGTNTTGYNNKYKYSGKIFCMKHNTTYHRKEFKYPSGNKEYWACKIYFSRGRQEDGCNSPILYTSELDESIKNAYINLITHKSEIIHDMIKTYSEVNDISVVNNNIKKVENEINIILDRKDKLLDLNLKGKLSDEEFEIRNEKFNNDILKLKEEKKLLENDIQKSTNLKQTIFSLRNMIENSLIDDDIIIDDIIDDLVEKIEVNNSDNQNEIKIEIYFRLFNEPISQYINRNKNKNKTSVCNEQSTL